MNRTARLALGSIVIGVLVLALKFAAYFVTGSVALFSDALESIINVVAAVAAFVALWVSARPADTNHPYGHTKAEYFSAVIEGVLVVIAALAIMREAYGAFANPKPLDLPLAGLLVSAAASLLNGVWATLLAREGRLRRSPALTADGKHLMADVVTSVGVLVGVILASVTGVTRLDAVLAGLVALNVLWSGWGLVRDSVSGLMDEAAPAETVQRIREVISTHAEGALEAHDVRTRHAGRVTFVEFHLVVPGDMSVRAAHDICDRLEEELKRELEDAAVTIHVEPEGKIEHKGVLVL
ncbi:cation diffusion facilitator family transporter [Deinococcus yavapaiensis]|uniref:Cation diffusion facilitator family transporter n=1 Tax=Deinococcus yavapaiensis KR-236 TaxID=694435 RepID=A0A318S050_9DEIO|nr:cation diffusion facilitator family transporter [Deinococcus yavapaiensis]PYE49945.1 cation diffusion facilitator family transporter [Deinococcus yavapaiensis KR-236]